MVLFSLPSKNYHQNYNRGTTCLMFSFLKNKNILFWKMAKNIKNKIHILQ